MTHKTRLKLYKTFVQDLETRGFLQAVNAILKTRGVILPDVWMGDRNKSVTTARREIWLAMKIRGMSESEIGRVFHMHPSSVWYGCSKHPTINVTGWKCISLDGEAIAYVRPDLNDTANNFAIDLSQRTRQKVVVE